MWSSTRSTKKPLPDRVMVDGVLWRTMESAPKHDPRGLRCSLYLWNGYETVVGYWSSCNPTGWIIDCGDYFDMVTPYYWSPVPKLPKGPEIS